MMDVLAAVIVVATFYIAWLGGGLGRSMSPVAAETALAAIYASVTVFDIAKRTAVPALSAAVVVAIVLGLFG